jgi:dienelactone hydrolase
MIFSSLIRGIAVSSLLMSTACSAQSTKTPAAGATAMHIVAPDSKKIAANYYPAANPKAVILLFHQAGDSYREYDLIGPRLATAGYSALAVDQRGGRGSEDFMEGKPDMEAAIAWAQDKKLPVIIWGSSYSASLVYVLAAENPGKVVAGLAFSGGDYLGGSLVPNAARKITIPMFATSSRGEVAEMKRVLDLVPGANKTFFAPKLGGVHGSSTLLIKKNRKGAEENWAAVMTFLGSVAP